MGSGKARLLGFCFASECFVLGVVGAAKRHVSSVTCPSGHLNRARGWGGILNVAVKLLPASSGLTVEGVDCGQRGVGTAVPLVVILDLPLANSYSEVFWNLPRPWHW